MSSQLSASVTSRVAAWRMQGRLREEKKDGEAIEQGDEREGSKLEAADDEAPCRGG